MAQPNVLIVMPAYNAAKTLKDTYEAIPENSYSDILVVDDASNDGTSKLAKQLGLRTITHRQNKGYGGNLKSCLTYAKQHKADVAVELHPDNQYDASQIPNLTRKVINEHSDLVIGSRFASPEGPGAYGMHWYRILANKFLSAIDRNVLGVNLSEFHTGFRAYSARFLTTVPFMKNKNNYSFSFEVIVQAIAMGLKVSEIPVISRYTKDSTSATLTNSTIYALETLDTLRKYIFSKYLGSHYPQFGNKQKNTYHNG